MAASEIVSNNLSDEESIVYYMNQLFSKPKDPLSTSSIQTYNGRLNLMKIKDYYNIDEINKHLNEIKSICTRKISCNALTYYSRIELEKIYSSAKDSDGNFNYTNEQRDIIKNIKPIKDMLTKCTIELGNKYEEERNKNELTEEELKSFMTWNEVIQMRDNMPDTNIYEKLILYLYTYFPPRRVKDYHLMYYSNKTSEEMRDEDQNKNYITSDSKFIFNIYIRLLSLIINKYLIVHQKFMN